MSPRSLATFITTFAVAGMLFAGSAHAEFAFPPEQTAKKLTNTAKKLKVPFPFERKLCVIQDQTNCAFIAESVVGMASGPEHGKADHIHLIYSPGEGTPTDMVFAWGILMALVSPEMSKDDRGELALRFFNAAIEPDFTSLTEERGAVTYAISRNPKLGLVFTATSEAP